MKLRNRQLVIDYHQLFESPGGQRILADLKKRASLLTQGVKPGTNIHTLLVMEGEANMVKYIYRMLDKDPNEELPEKAVSN
jgi:hypothetical protein